MCRHMFIGAAAVAAILSGNPTAVFAQPPRPPDVVRKIDHDVKRAVTHTDRAVRRAVHKSNHRVRRVTRRAVHSRVRALCNDGRVHAGRTRVTACVGHGGLRG